MKKVIILLSVVLIIMAAAFFAYTYFKPSARLSDNAKITWLEVCGSNAKCAQGVEKHYLFCANSVSFEKPKDKSDLAEYISLTRLEIESCLSEKIGADFPID